MFVREVERGKETVQFGRVMQMLAELGIELHADVQDEVQDEVQDMLSALKAKGVKPFTPRTRRTAGDGAAPAPELPTGGDK